MYVRCNVKKGTSDATDFTTNYQSKVVSISKMIVGGGMIFIQNVDYTTFKGKIDGNVITWDMVKLREDKNNYELWLEVD